MKDADKVGDMIKMDMERFMMMEMVHTYNLTLKEVNDICSFAKTLYVSNRKEEKKDEKVSDE